MVDIINNMSLVEKYRPKYLTNIVGQENITKLLSKIVENCKNNKMVMIPNLLFYGLPGTGKTTTILAFCNELFGPKYIKDRVLEINASSQRGIDNIRNTVMKFARYSINNFEVDRNNDKMKKYFKKYPVPPFKIIILDEADALTMEAQTSLRKIMEDYSNNTRFCIICNYYEKIIKPLVSRCIYMNFNPINNIKAQKYLKIIMKKENLNINDQKIEELLAHNNGDLRKIINTLQEIEQ
jgi:replication factor C subunit 2/4